MRQTKSKETILAELGIDRALVDAHRITAQELDALASSAMFGRLASRDDVVFMLKRIREALSSATLDETMPRKLAHTPSDGPRANAIEHHPAEVRGSSLSRTGLSMLALAIQLVIIWCAIQWLGQADRLLRSTLIASETMLVASVVWSFLRRTSMAESSSVPRHPART